MKLHSDSPLVTIKQERFIKAITDPLNYTNVPSPNSSNSKMVFFDPHALAVLLCQQVKYCSLVSCTILLNTVWCCSYPSHVIFVCIQAEAKRCIYCSLVQNFLIFILPFHTNITHNTSYKMFVSKLYFQNLTGCCIFIIANLTVEPCMFKTEC